MKNIIIVLRITLTYYINTKNSLKNKIDNKQQIIEYISVCMLCKDYLSVENTYLF